MYWVEAQARQYAEERTTDEEKKEAFLAGVKWYAEQVWRLLDQGPYWSLMDKATKNMSSQAALEQLQNDLARLMKRQESIDETTPGEKETE